MNKFSKKTFKKDWISVVEVLTSAVTLLNTFALVIVRNTLSYESVNTFDPIQKSSYTVIMQHNPFFGYIFLVCAFVMMACALHRYRDWTKQKDLSN